MEQSHELRLITIKKALLDNELYIPLQGKHTTNIEEEPFDLAEKIKQFFVFDEMNSSDPRVMLLLGDTGSGKSVFSQQIFQLLWQEKKDIDPIPIWIPLPELQLPFESAAEEVLKSYEFSEAKISELKAKEKFIFIVDGYDELHQFQNCYVTNKWSNWNAKVLITCRSQALYYQQDPDKYFVPFNGEKRLPWLLRKLYVAPFSADQITAYVEQYNRIQPQELDINVGDFDKTPGLKELITTPFLLHLTVESLPDILANLEAGEENSKMTQAKLYDVFIERWFTRQINKLHTAGQLTDSEEETKKRFWDYCKRLASEMHAQEITVIQYARQKAGGRLFGNQKKNSWEQFFNESTKVLRSACPIKKIGDHQYGFIHASLVEYFATRAMYEEIQDQDVTEEEEDRNKNDDKEEREIDKNRLGPNKPKGGLHYRVFAREPNAIRNIADRIEMSEKFKRKMLMIVEKSKECEQYAIGAANAITALVRAGITFNGENLSGIKIRGADVSGGYFAGVNLEGSDLTDVVMVRAYLGHGNLRGCQLSGVTFGEYPGFQHVDSVKSLDYRQDLNRLVTGSRYNIVLWDIQTEQSVKVLHGHQMEVNSVQFSADGLRVVSGSDDKTVRIWDNARSEAKVLRGHQEKVNSVQFSAGGLRVVSGSDDKTIRIWDIARSEVKVLRGHQEKVNSVQFSADGLRVVSGSDDKTIRVWYTARSEVKVLRGHQEKVNSVQFNLEGDRIVSGSDDYTVRIWDVASGQAKVLQGHESWVTSVQFSLDGDRVVSGSNDHTVRVWDVASGQAKVLRGHEHFVSSVQFNPEGNRVVSAGGSDKSVRVWKIANDEAKVLQEHENLGSHFQFSAKSNQVVSVSKDTTVRVWDIASGKVRILQGHTKLIRSVQFSAEGDRLVSGGKDKAVRVWDIASGEATVLRGHERDVTSAVFSPDGQRIVSGSSDNTVRIWDIVSGEATVLRGHNLFIQCVQFSANGKRVVSGSYDNTVRIWDISNGEATVLRGHENVVSSVRFSANGKRVVSGSYDNTVRVWDIASGEAKVLRGHENWVTNVQFTAEGERVMSGSWDKTIRVWDIEHEQSIYCIAFHMGVISFSWRERTGLLCVGFKDGTIQYWHWKENPGQSLHFKWSSSTHSPTLFLNDCDITGAIGLSSQNKRLLSQRGAIDIESREINSSGLPEELKKATKITLPLTHIIVETKFEDQILRFDERESTIDTTNNSKKIKSLREKLNLSRRLNDDSKKPNTTDDNSQSPEVVSQRPTMQAPQSPNKPKGTNISISSRQGKSTKMGAFRSQSPRRKKADAELIDPAPAVQETRRFKPAPPAPQKPKSILDADDPTAEESGKDQTSQSSTSSRSRFFNHRSPRKATVLKKDDIDSIFEATEEEVIKESLN